MAFRTLGVLVLCICALASPALAEVLKGPVTAKPSRRSGATLDVLGVPVRVDAHTRFDDFFPSGPTLENLRVGNVLELSGQFDANGVLHATRIEAKHASPVGRTFEIKGPVTDLRGSAPTQTFKVRGVTFATNMSTRLDMWNGLANGAVVKVKTLSTTAPFVAVRVKGTSDDDSDHRDFEEARAQGLVSGLTGSSPSFSFMLDGRRVITNSGTWGLAHVQPNARIKAKGPLDASGAILATKVSVDDDDDDHEGEDDD